MHSLKNTLTDASAAPYHAQPENKGLATQADACRFLKVSRQYIWLQTKKGRINPVRFGRIVRYSWSEIEKIAAEGLPGGDK
ncbi:MAG: helix-turn-helix domain-containing protein [Candidatus Igneacidithiobacillus chanchocoensis]